jgi:phage pi2 protein 07
MTYKIISEALTKIISTIQTSVVSSTRVIIGTVFSVRVKNLPKVQDIKGTVIVGNQKNVEEKLKELKKAITSFSQKTHEVKVNNWQEPQSLAKLEDSTVNVAKTIEKLIPELKRIEQTTKLSKTEVVEVSNQPVSELKAVLKALEKLDLKLKNLKLNPQINVESAKLPTPIVNVPETKVVVEKTEYDWQELLQSLQNLLYSKDAKKYLSVRLSDGNKFYEAMKEMMAIASGGGSLPFSSSAGDRSAALLDSNRRIQTVIYAEDINSPGVFRAVQGQYNDNGNFELLTAGSGSTTPVEKDGLWNSTNTSWNDTSINWNQE